MSEPLQACLFVTGTATFSPCGAYRYTLTRDLGGEGGTYNFIMLNPSTADAEEDDPTIRRCIGFCRSWGYSRLVVTNLFAFRSTDPKALAPYAPYAADPVGDENDAVLLGQASAADLVVCAWGCHGTLEGRGRAVCRLLTNASIPLASLRLTKDGHPSHPLYLPGDSTPARWASWNV